MLSKRILILLLSFVAAMVSTYADESQFLVVATLDGKKVHYPLEEKPEVSFSGNYLIVTTENDSKTFPLDQMENIYYVGISGIDDISSDSQSFSLDGRNLSVTGMTNNTILHLYSIDGHLAFSSPLKQGKSEISLGSLSPGIYILKIGTITGKIILE